MESKDKSYIQQEILRQYPRIDPEVDVNWVIVEVSFKAGMREVAEWLRQYAIHGSKVPLEDVLADLETHSPYGKPNLRNENST